MLWALPRPVSSEKSRLDSQRYSRGKLYSLHVSSEACGHLGDFVDRTRQHASNRRTRPAECHAAMQWALSHYRANIATFGSLPAGVVVGGGLSGASELGLGLGLLCNDACLRWCLTPSY